MVFGKVYSSLLDTGCRLAIVQLYGNIPVSHVLRIRVYEGWHFPIRFKRGFSSELIGQQVDPLYATGDSTAVLSD